MLEGDLCVPVWFVWSSGLCQTTVRKRQSNCHSANVPSSNSTLNAALTGQRGALEEGRARMYALHSPHYKTRD